jgi:hypothetical protein
LKNEACACDWGVMLPALERDEEPLTFLSFLAHETERIRAGRALPGRPAKAISCGTWWSPGRRTFGVLGLSVRDPWGLDTCPRGVSDHSPHELGARHSNAPTICAGEDR